MATIQLKNLPDDIVMELRDRARQFGRDIEEEAAAVIVQAVTNDMWRKKLTAQELLDRARKLREGHPHASVTEEFLRTAKDDGRP